MGKTAFLVLGVVIGSSWLASRESVPSASECVESSRTSGGEPARSEPEPDDHQLDQLKEVGGALWNRVLQPVLASAATHALDALSHLLREATTESRGDGRSHAALDKHAPGPAASR